MKKLMNLLGGRNFLKSKAKKSKNKNNVSKAYLLGGLLVLLIAAGLYASFDDMAERELEKFNVPPSPIESSDLTGALATVTNSDLPSYSCSDGTTQTMGAITPNVDSGHYFLFHVNNDTTLNNALASIKKDNSNYIIVGYDETLPGSFASPYKFVEYLSDYYEGTQRDNLNSTIKAGTVFVVQSLNRNDVCNRSFDNPTFRQSSGLNIGWYLAPAPQGFKDGRITKAYAASYFFSPTSVTLDATNGLAHDGYYWFKVDFTRNSSDPMNGGSTSGSQGNGSTNNSSATTGGQTMGCSSVANSQGTFGPSDVCGSGSNTGGNTSGNTGGDQPVEFSFDYTNNSIEQGQAYNYLSNENKTFVANGVEQAQSGNDTLGSLIGADNELVSNNDFVKIIDFKFDAVTGTSTLSKLDLNGLEDYLDKALVYLDDTRIGEYITSNLDFDDLTLDNTLDGKSLYVYVSLKPALVDAPLSPTVLASMDAYPEPIAISGNSTINYITKSSNVSNPNRFLVSLGGDDQERKIGSYEINLNQVANLLPDADLGVNQDLDDLTRDSLNLYAIKGQLVNADEWFSSMSAKIYADGQTTQVSVPMELTATGFESKINFKTLDAIKRAVRLNNFDTQTLTIDFHAISLDNPPVDSSDVLIDLYLDSSVNQINTRIQKATSFEANGATHAYAYSSVDVMSPFAGTVTKLVNFITTPLIGFDILSNTEFNLTTKSIRNLSSKSVDYLTFFYDIDSPDSVIPADTVTALSFVNKVGDLPVETNNLVEYSDVEIDGNMLTSSISFKNGLDEALYDLTTIVAGVELPEAVEVRISDSETNLTSYDTSNVLGYVDLDTLNQDRQIILLDLEGEYNEDVEVYELLVSLTDESSDIVDSIYLDLPDDQNDIALNKIEGSNLYSLASSLLADSDEYYFNPSLKTANMDNFMYPLVMQFKPAADIDLVEDSLEIEAIELITNADLEITIVADDEATPEDESLSLDDFNSVNSRMFSASLNPIISFVDETNNRIASPLAANAYLFDAPGEEFLGKILINDALYDASNGGDVLKLEIGEDQPLRSIVLKQGDNFNAINIPDESTYSVFPAHNPFDLTLPIEVYIKTLDTDANGENYAVNYSVEADGVSVGDSITSNVTFEDSSLEFTYTPDPGATVNNIDIDSFEKIGDIILSAEPLLDSDLNLSLSFVSNASFVSPEYQYCLDLDSSDNDDPICFADQNGDTTFELDFAFTADDLDAELFVKRIADPADLANPFTVVNQSFTITVNSNYKIDGTINVTGVNIAGVTPVPAP
ncbi:hypothetical protein HOJ01_03085 [bacterium]|jgi:hypothetical protein|nr:hypothetical protein [bacterium]MBT6293769.1 hypothetical protein [bacterium]